MEVEKYQGTVEEHRKGECVYKRCLNEGSHRKVQISSCVKKVLQKLHCFMLRGQTGHRKWDTLRRAQILSRVVKG